MPSVNFDCVTCHNFIPSLTMRMDDGDQYFEKKNKLCPKTFHNARCLILIDR